MDYRRTSKALMVGVVIVLIAAFFWWLTDRGEPASNASAEAIHAVEQGNAELLDPRGFYEPWTALQVGRNATYNIQDGRDFTVPPSCGPEDVYECMLQFWGQRWDNAVYQFSGGFYSQISWLVGYGYQVAKACVEQLGINICDTVAALQWESTYAMNPACGGNYFGILCYSIPRGDFLGQLPVFARIMQEAAAAGCDTSWKRGHYYNEPGGQAYADNWDGIAGGVR